MAKLICNILGAVFVVVGLSGFLIPGLMGAHLSTAHNIIHLVSGMVALYFGTKGTYEHARQFCFLFGAVYGLLGVAGLFCGPGTPSVPPTSHSSHLMLVIPGVLELGGIDHIMHILIAALFIIGGMLPERDMLKEQAKHSV